MEPGWWWALPWDFSPTIVTLALLSAGWYWRRSRMVPAWRRVSFWLGWAALYSVLQSGLDYYAQHAFFVHRIQHLVLHHAGPFLIALGLPPATFNRWGSAPAWLRRSTHPWVSAALFNGLVLFWLLPAVHLPAMLDGRLYRLMNWSMALNGLLFWILVLRGATPGWRVGAAQRIGLMLAVVPLQIASGALIFFSTNDLYPGYALCGRAFGMTALQDQQIGGLILWIPGAMMSVLGILLVGYPRLSERRERA
jgi:putative membrane protein